MFLLLIVHFLCSHRMLYLNLFTYLLPISVLSAIPSFPLLKPIHLFFLLISPFLYSPPIPLTCSTFSPGCLPGQQVCSGECPERPACVQSDINLGRSKRPIASLHARQVTLAKAFRVAGFPINRPNAAAAAAPSQPLSKAPCQCVPCLLLILSLGGGWGRLVARVVVLHDAELFQVRFFSPRVFFFLQVFFPRFFPAIFSSEFFFSQDFFRKISHVVFFLYVFLR